MRSPVRTRGGGRAAASTFVLLALAVMVLAGGSSAARAIETDTFRLEPSPPVVHGYERRTFAYELEEGEAVSDAISLENLTDEPRTFRLFAADAAVEVGTGTISIASSRAEPVGVGSWADLDVSEVTLGADESIEVGFTVARPAGTATEGTGAIVAEEIIEDPTSGGISVVYRLAILIRIGGDVAGLDVSEPWMTPPLELFPSRSELRVELRNETLQTVRATVRSSAAGLTGRYWGLGEQEVELGAGESREVVAAWNEVPRWGGVFQPAVDVTWAAGSIVRTGPRAFHPPLWLVGLAILLVAVRGIRELRAASGR